MSRSNNDLVSLFFSSVCVVSSVLCCVCVFFICIGLITMGSGCMIQRLIDWLKTSQILCNHMRCTKSDTQFCLFVAFLWVLWSWSTLRIAKEWRKKESRVTRKSRLKCKNRERSSKNHSHGPDGFLVTAVISISACQQI